jgi:hypothetical protein
MKFRVFWDCTIIDYSSGSESGNTPTGVGKTKLNSGKLPIIKKHPHGRGENNPVHPFFLHGLETPPRAWGKLYLN